MTTKKFLSNKRTSQQTISISPSLKDWIERYVNVNQKKSPDDDRFSSISAFYNHVMESTLNCFEKGKTFDDFEKFVDGEIKNLFEEFTFKASIPFYELLVETNRYTTINFDLIPYYMFTLRKIYKKFFSVKELDSLYKNIERYKNFALSSKIVKEIKVNIITARNEKKIRFTFEYLGLEKNLHFENCKLNAAILGMMGAKITDFVYSDKEMYCRFDFELTDLFYRNDLAHRERFELIKHNLSHFVNYNRIIYDKDYYLWMKMADDKDLIITFNNDMIRQKWLDLIENELKKYSTKEDFLLGLLKFFEKLHWIDIENEKEHIFQMKISKEKNDRERNFLLEVLSKYSKISQIEEKYCLE